jgi:predicted secreted protein
MKKLLFPLIVAAVLLAACSGQAAQPTAVSNPPTANPDRPTPSAAELVATDPSKPIEVAAGSEFTITVLADLAADYHWEVAEALDPSFVEFVWKDHVNPDPNNPKSVARDVWRFKAVGPGTTTITLGYYQGESDNAPQMPVFTVVVK